MTPLCKLAFKYHTDKCPQIRHAYTPYYDSLFKNKREQVKKVMELGIEHGGSLRMWRDYFPNAQIYGVDINPNALFTARRITTFQANAMHGGEWDPILKETGTDIDIFVDDGLHAIRSQINVARYLMPRLDRGVTYIIEDVRDVPQLRERMPEYECFEPELPGKRDFIGNTILEVRHRV